MPRLTSRRCIGWFFLLALLLAVAGGMSDVSRTINAFHFPAVPNPDRLWHAWALVLLAGLCELEAVAAFTLGRVRAFRQHGAQTIE